VSSLDPNFRPAPDTSAGGTVAYYREYTYDKLGNMLDLYHHGVVGNRFHRVFNSASSDPFELSNLCEDIAYAGTVVGYIFDANGNMLSEGSSRSFEWDYGDRMRWFEEGTVTAAYLYDAGGNRVKKVVRKSSSLKEVTVYIDRGFVHCCSSSKVFMIALQLNTFTRSERFCELVGLKYIKEFEQRLIF
jgi:hypothetical protein